MSPSKLILGPTKSGKTSLLACLDLAVSARDPNAEPKLDVRPWNQDTTDLFHLARNTMRSGRIPIAGTAELRRYEFLLTLRRKKDFVLFKGREEETDYTFTMPDAPGGALFSAQPADDLDMQMLTRFRSEQIDLLKVADGLIICLDPTDRDVALSFFIDLPKFLAETGQRRLPVSRVVVVLTKADKIVSRHGRNAFRELARLSAREFGQKILTQHGMNALRTFLPRETRIGFCWTSIYGFLDTGETNYDVTGDCLLYHPESAPGKAISAAEAISRWRPFQIFDPFLFAGTGVPMPSIEFA